MSYRIIVIISACIIFHSPASAHLESLASKLHELVSLRGTLELSSYSPKMENTAKETLDKYKSTAEEISHIIKNIDNQALLDFKTALPQTEETVDSILEILGWTVLPEEPQEYNLCEFIIRYVIPPLFS